MTAHSQLQIDMIRVVHCHSTFWGVHMKNKPAYTGYYEVFKHTDNTDYNH